MFGKTELEADVLRRILRRFTIERARVEADESDLMFWDGGFHSMDEIIAEMRESKLAFEGFAYHWMLGAYIVELVEHLIETAESRTTQPLVMPRYEAETYRQTIFNGSPICQGVFEFSRGLKGESVELPELELVGA